MALYNKSAKIDPVVMIAPFVVASFVSMAVMNAGRVPPYHQQVSTAADARAQYHEIIAQSNSQAQVALMGSVFIAVSVPLAAWLRKRKIL